MKARCRKRMRVRGEEKLEEEEDVGNKLGRSKRGSRKGGKIELVVGEGKWIEGEKDVWRKIISGKEKKRK